MPHRHLIAEDGNTGEGPQAHPASSSDPEPNSGPELNSSHKRNSSRGRWLRALALTLALLLLAFLAAAEYAARHLSPVLRSSILATLSQRLHAPVELDSIQVSVVKGWGGIQVEGAGLRVLTPVAPAGAGPAPAPAIVSAQPLLSVAHFRFRASLDALLHRHIDLDWVSIDGLDLHLPPHHAPAGGEPQPGRPAPQSPIRITLHHIECRNANLFIASSNPAKQPLTFRIQDLKLTVPDSDASSSGSPAPGPALLYDAQIINPKPIGAVHATGHFGPWNRNNPRATPLDGHYTFSNADLSSIKGIDGTLFSTGNFYGPLDRIQIDGSTRTPNFSLDVGQHPLPLFTTFHATVDGAGGDTTLTSVHALLSHSRFTTQGTILNIHGQGHDIHLTAHMSNGRIQDLLMLGMKSPQPVMLGTVAFDLRIHIPPGKQRVIEKIQIAGTVNIQGVQFTNVKLQNRINSLSLRAQGQAEQAAAAGQTGRSLPLAASQMNLEFSLDHAMLVVPSLQYLVPGGSAQLHGAYFLNAGAFEFLGHIRTQAMPSQMVTGWKSALLKSLNPLFKAHGAGLQLPVAITGSNNTVRFGLARNPVDEPASLIADDLRATFPSLPPGAPKSNPQNAAGNHPASQP
ncbi:MAG: hypothetical protein ACP5E5_11440 [Acidobacteriaceae bacterium]